MNHYIFDNEIKNQNGQTNNEKNKTSNPFNQLKQNEDFLMPKISNMGQPLNKKHESYMFDRNAELFYSQNQGNYMNPVNTRSFDSNANSNIPVQNSFQTNYYMSNFETINQQQEQSMFLDRNPVNSRRDQMEKSRNTDRVSFLNTQGGNLTNFTPMSIESTREKKKHIDISSYIPNSVNMAVPKENI